MRYAAVGFGRSGSKWTADILCSIMDRPWLNDDIYEWANDPLSVMHANQVWGTLMLPPPPESLIIFCFRRDNFLATISLEMAIRSGEWYHYSNKPIEPFTVDPKEFFDQVRTHRDSQDAAARYARQNNIPHVVSYYEDLLEASDPYEHIATLIGYTEPIIARRKGPGPNPRKPEDFISNYAELEKIWREKNAPK